MPMYSISILYFLCSLFILWILIKTLKRKDSKSKILAGVLFCAFFALFFYGIVLLVKSHLLASVFYMIIFSLTDFSTVLLCIYIYLFTYGKKVNVLIKIIAFSFAVFDSMILLVNPFFNEFAIKIFPRLNNGNLYYSYGMEGFGPYFYVHLGFIYVIMLSFFIVILFKCNKSSLLYSEKYFMSIIIVLIISLFNIAFYTGFIKMWADYSFLLFALAAGVTYYYNYNYQPVLLISKARSKVLEYVRIPFVLFDNEGILADMNIQAERIFALTKNDLSVLTIEKFLERLGIKLHGDFQEKNADFDVILYPDGEETHLRGEYDVLRDLKSRIIGEVFLFHNRTKEDRVMEELENIANYDSLTGLPNKYNLEKIKNDFISRENFPISVVVANINEMKLINDVFGESVGDEIVKFIASSIRKALPRKHYVARIDNEFVAVLTNTDYEEARKKFYEISLKTDKNKYFEMGIGFEFGISTMEESDRDVSQLINEAFHKLGTKKTVKRKNIKTEIIENYKRLIVKNQYENDEHCKNIWCLSKKIAEKLNMKAEKIGQLEMLSYLHDIGKLAIPKEILMKPEMLNEHEWDIIKSHTSKGYAIAKSNRDLGEIAFYILSHHERWDGKGYPNGLKEDDIPLSARILSVVDSYVSMTHDRPYRSAISKNSAMGEIKSLSGTHFDPKIVEILIKILREDNLILEEI